MRTRKHKPMEPNLTSVIAKVPREDEQIKMLSTMSDHACKTLESQGKRPRTQGKLKRLTPCAAETGMSSASHMFFKPSRLSFDGPHAMLSTWAVVLRRECPTSSASLQSPHGGSCTSHERAPRLWGSWFATPADCPQ